MARLAIRAWLVAAVLAVPPAGAVGKSSGGPRLHVVSVGVARYKDPRLNLQYADSDALAFADTITNQSRTVYERLTRTVLTNRYATSSTVRRLLQRLREESGPEDTVALFLSGHGGYDGKLGYFFVTYEADIDQLAPTVLLWSDVVKTLRALKARRLLVFIDSCSAGGALGDAAAGSAKLAASLSKAANTMVFCSSRGDEASLELAAKEHGAFTEALLDAFAGEADLAGEDGRRDGRITLGELRDYVPKRVSQLSKGRQNPAVPNLGGCDPASVLLLIPRQDKTQPKLAPVESLLPDVGEEAPE